MKTKNKYIIGIFDEDDKILDAAWKMKDSGVKVEDCFTPHPIHHLDHALGIKRTRLTIVAFICGGIGSVAALYLMTYMNVFDWPMNVGGKPNDGYYPSFIPVTFELTILFTAIGMATTFFGRSKMMPGVMEQLEDIRQTDDLYVMTINADKQKLSEEELKNLLINQGAIEVRVQG